MQVNGFGFKVFLERREDEKKFLYLTGIFGERDIYIYMQDKELLLINGLVTRFFKSLPNAHSLCLRDFSLHDCQVIIAAAAAAVATDDDDVRESLDLLQRMETDFLGFRCH